MNKDNMMGGNDTCTIHHAHRICWSAIFGGALVGVGLAFLLHLYTAAIGLSAFSSSTNQGASIIAMGGLLGMLVGVIAAMLTAGFVAGYLGRFHYHPQHGGVIYGFVTWSLILLLCAVMASPMQKFVAGYGAYVTHSQVMYGPSLDASDASADKTEVTIKKDNSKATIATVDAKKLACAGWILFALFAVGALSSCIGACYGIRCKKE